MYKGEDGTMQYGGIDVSVGQYIAESMGKELKVENMSFDYLLPSWSRVTSTLSSPLWKQTVKD